MQVRTSKSRNSVQGTSRDGSTPQKAVARSGAANHHRQKQLEIREALNPRGLIGSAGLTTRSLGLLLQKKSDYGTNSTRTKSPVAPSHVRGVLASPGRPLDRATRTFMEERFGHDFSQVRVHTDAQASTSARVVNALSYTVGNDVVFGAGRYQPQTTPGRHLLAHELTHVIQQEKASSIGASARLSHPSEATEQLADAAALALTNGHRPPDVRAVSVGLIQRQHGLHGWEYETAEHLIDIHTHGLDLDEGGLAQELFPRVASGEYGVVENVLSILNEALFGTDTDDVAFELARRLLDFASSALTNRLIHTGGGQQLINRLHTEIMSGMPDSEEINVANRLLLRFTPAPPPRPSPTPTMTVPTRPSESPRMPSLTPRVQAVIPPEANRPTSEDAQIIVDGIAVCSSYSAEDRDFLEVMSHSLNVTQYTNERLINQGIRLNQLARLPAWRTLPENQRRELRITAREIMDEVQQRARRLLEQRADPRLVRGAEISEDHPNPGRRRVSAAEYLEIGHQLRELGLFGSITFSLAMLQGVDVRDAMSRAQAAGGVDAVLMFSGSAQLHRASLPSSAPRPRGPDRAPGEQFGPPTPQVAPVVSPAGVRQITAPLPVRQAQAADQLRAGVVRPVTVIGVRSATRPPTTPEPAQQAEQLPGQQLQAQGTRIAAGQSRGRPGNVQPTAAVTPPRQTAAPPSRSVGPPGGGRPTGGGGGASGGGGPRRFEWLRSSASPNLGGALPQRPMVDAEMQQTLDNMYATNPVIRILRRAARNVNRIAVRQALIDFNRETGIGVELLPMDRRNPASMRTRPGWLQIDIDLFREPDVTRPGGLWEEVVHELSFYAMGGESGAFELMATPNPGSGARAPRILETYIQIPPSPRVSIRDRLRLVEFAMTIGRLLETDVRQLQRQESARTLWQLQQILNSPEFPRLPQGTRTRLTGLETQLRARASQP